MKDKTVLITGSTDGIGKQAVLDLGRMGANVIIHGRSKEKVEAVQKELAPFLPDAKLETCVGDLSSLSQVVTLAKDISSRYKRLDALIHNAGVMVNEEKQSADGIELTFAVNHLAPFVLTHHLLPLLRTSHTRVINVSSMAHRNGSAKFGSANDLLKGGYAGYSQSKLANVLFSNELARREKEHFTSNSLHPGVVSTKLLKTGFGFEGPDTLQRGAATMVMLASAPEMDGVTGQYFDDCKKQSPSSNALDTDIQAQLWKLSEQMTAKWL